LIVIAAVTSGRRRRELIPADACPGDVGGGEVSVPDGKVNVSDLFYIINNWG
jgi:hypothetical protein